MQQIKVGYQGAHGTFSEIAVRQFFDGQDIQCCNYTGFADIIEDVRQGVIDYALLPVENTTTGIIYRTVDLLKDSDLFAMGEELVRIDEQLIVLPGTRMEDIREVYSHPEPLNQCSRFFNEHPEFLPVAYQDTAKSVEYVAQCRDHHKAALGSWLAAEYYQLEILQHRVQDQPLNTTRFFCVSAKKEIREGADKISMCFTVKHEPGALYRVISVFAKENINMLKLESRPIPGKLFEYCFYIDFDGNLEEASSLRAIEQVREHCVEVKILGCYRKAYTGGIV